MLDSERDRIFNDWLAGHKGILFKVVHAYAFELADRQDLFYLAPRRRRLEALLKEFDG